MPDTLSKERPRRPTPISRTAAVALGLLLLTAIETRVVDLIQQPNRSAQEAVALGILSGHPAWRFYQSRVLGPWLVVGLEQIAHISFTASYRAICISLLFVGNAVCFVVFGGTRNRKAWPYVLALAGLFIALQDHTWLYLWDYVDVPVFLLFAYWTVVQPRPGRVAGLFFIELLNREVALFFAFWIAIDAVDLRGHNLTVRWRQLAVGIGLAALGQAWLTALSRHLFLLQTLPAGQLAFGDVLWMWPHNLGLVVGPPSRLELLVVLAALMTTPLLMARAWRSLGDRAWKVSLLLGSYTAATLAFTMANETRGWLCFIPFWLCLDWCARRGDPG